MGAEQDLLELGPGRRLLRVQAVDLRGLWIVQITAFFDFIGEYLGQSRIADIVPDAFDYIIRASGETEGLRASEKGSS
jgi:hypothetical protein